MSPLRFWKNSSGIYRTIPRTVRGPRVKRFSFVSSPKQKFRWEKFDDDDEMQEAVMTWFKEQEADVYDSGIQKLVPRLNKCLDNAGD
jgi:hypothetical protein